jgi:hypothetical protein
MVVIGYGASSPRAPAAINNDAATRMAATSVAVTSAVGDLIILRSRCGSSCKPAQNQIGFNENG